MNSGSNSANKGVNFTQQSLSQGVGNYLYPTASKVLLTISANDASNIVKFYVNENLIGSSSGATQIDLFTRQTIPGGATDQFVFGYNAVTYLSGSLFKGAVSDLLLYNKELSLTEVSESYAFLQTQGC
jgi:hypothetical protein